MNKNSALWHALPPLALLTLLIAYAGNARAQAAQAVRLAATVVFPSLFPFCVVTRRLTRSDALRLPNGVGRLFGVPGTGLGALVLGLCGGYPLGAMTACSLYETKQLDAEAARRLLRFCNNTGPAIFFGMLSAVVFPEASVCAMQFAIHIASALLTGLLLAPFDPQRPSCPQTPAPPTAETLPESLRQSVLSTAQLCGYVIFFSVVLHLTLSLPAVTWLLEWVPLPQPVTKAIVSAAVDLPSGIAAIAQVGSPAARFLLCAVGVSWGGVCVHLQAAGVWQAARLEVKGYYGAKLLQTALAFALSFPALRLLYGSSVPMWPGLVPLFLLAGKTGIAIFRQMRYNKEKLRIGRPIHAVPQKNTAPMRLLLPVGKRG